MIYQVPKYDPGKIYRDGVGAGKSVKADYPLLIWNKDLENDENFRDLAQRVSDVLLMRCGCLFEDSVNPPDNYNVFWGILKKEEYKKTTDTWNGGEGAAELQDFSFFEPWINKLAGMILNAPDQLDVKNMSLSWVESKMKKTEEVLMERLKRKMNQQMSAETQGGIDLSFTENPGIYVPDSDEELLSYLDENEQLQYILWALIKASIENNPTKVAEIECLLDMFIVGFEVTEIKTKQAVGYTQAYVKRVPPANLAYLGPTNLKTLDGARAIGTRDYVTLDQALEEYGWQLKDDPRFKDLETTVENIRKDQNWADWKYQPNYMANAQYMNSMASTEQGSRNDPWSANYWGDTGTDLWGDYQWGNGFYPTYWRSEAGSPLLLRMPFIFKVIKKQNRKVTIDGKNPTEEQKKLLYDNSPHMIKPNVRLEIVDEDYVAKKGEHIVPVSIGVWYEAVRLGHCIILGLQPYRYDQDSQKINDPTKNRSRIVMRNLRRKSIVTLGKWFAHHANNIMYHLSEQLNMMGAEYAIDIYQDELPPGMDVEKALFLLKKAGVRVRKRPEEGDMQRGNSAGAYRIGNDTNMATGLVQLYLTMMSLFDSIIGPIANNTIQQAEGLGKTRILADQGSLAVQLMLWEHTQHWGDVYARMGDILKIENEDIPPVMVHLGKGETEVLRTTKGLSAQDYGIFFRNGIKAVQDRDQMIQDTMQVASAGGDQDILRLLFELRGSDNPMEAYARVQKYWDQYKGLQEQRDQAAQVAQQQQTEVAMQKINVPVQVEQIRSQTDIQKTQMKIDADLQKQDMKGDQADIDAQNQREEMILDAGLQAATEPPITPTGGTAQ